MGNQFTYYDSTMASAPVLAPTAGSIIALLDACLVNGFGTKAAAGWAKVFSGTNKAVYRAATGVRHFLRILDDATTSPFEGAVNAGVAFCATPYESMSDVDTGTNPFPTTLNHCGPKNGLSGRAWWLYADALTFYLFTDITGSGTKTGFSFGEFNSFQANDPYRTLFRHCSVSSLNAVDALDTITTSSGGATLNSWIPRGHTGVLPPVNVCISGDASRSGGSTVLKGTIVPYPNPADGGLYMAPVWIHDPSTVPTGGLRGRMRGFWHFLHPTAGVIDGQPLSGTGDLAGKTFTILKPSGGAGVYLMETSATLETST